MHGVVGGGLARPRAGECGAGGWRFAVVSGFPMRAEWASGSHGKSRQGASRDWRFPGLHLAGSADGSRNGARPVAVVNDLSAWPEQTGGTDREVAAGAAEGVVDRCPSEAGLRARQLAFRCDRRPVWLDPPIASWDLAGGAGRRFVVTAGAGLRNGSGRRSWRGGRRRRVVSIEGWPFARQVALRCDRRPVWLGPSIASWGSTGGGGQRFVRMAGAGLRNGSGRGSSRGGRRRRLVSIEGWPFARQVALRCDRRPVWLDPPIASWDLAGGACRRFVVTAGAGLRNGSGGGSSRGGRRRRLVSIEGWALGATGGFAL
jgi:hypothetical protein